MVEIILYYTVTAILLNCTKMSCLGLVIFLLFIHIFPIPTKLSKYNIKN